MTKTAKIAIISYTEDEAKKILNESKWRYGGNCTNNPYKSGGNVRFFINNIKRKENLIWTFSKSNKF